ncbi:MAG: ABC transporter substrate-binding protein [Gemmatimonas sp.]|nr:ABC transporter substrate-binding protein [Gemmatimonas sp.]
MTPIVVSYASSRSGRGLLGLALIVLVAACDRGADGRSISVDGGGEANQYEVRDDAGRVVRLPGPAQRIVSLLPATTETLGALGAIDRLVARTDFDDPELSWLPSVGGGLTPNIELVASLSPDLVIAWEEAGEARVRPRLEAIGIPVLAVATRDTAGVFANIDRLGVLTGLTERADSLAARMREELADVRASVAGREPRRVLYLIGVDPPMVAGPNVFIGEVLEVSGGLNVFSDLQAPSPQVSMEEILRRQPEVVLHPATGASTASAESLQTMPGWRELLQSGETRFVALPPDVLHRPGPSIVEAAWTLRNAIYPELRRPE